VSGFDPEGQLSGFEAASEPQNSSVSVAVDGTYTLNIDPGFVGTDNFNFVAIDVEGQTGIGTVSVTVYDTDMPTDTGGAGNDVFLAGEEANFIYGNAGNDLIRGGGGDDYLYGGRGNDSLFGDAGYDFLRGGDGGDYLDVGAGGGNALGESGDDILVGGTDADYLHTGSGYDIVYAHGGNDTVVFFGGEQGDMAYGGAGSDTLYFHANLGSNFIEAHDDLLTVNGHLVARDFEDFWLYGDISGDTVSGGAHADHIYGGDGTDALFGGAGNDRIYGGAGADILTGGSGSDYFVFSSAEGNDFITDFVAGAGTDDVVDLLAFESAVASAAVANATQVGNDTVLNFGDDQTLTLMGVDVTTLHSNDFLIG
jgi:Ca2+-binding RTX toxin-like protein